MDNATYASWLGPILVHLRGFTVTIDDVIEDAQENKVVMLGHSTASTDVGPYANEVGLPVYSFRVILNRVSAAVFILFHSSIPFLNMS
jgi:hypothetical protein